MRQVPSGASGGRGLNGLIVFLTRKFHETSVTRSLIGGKVCIGSTVTGSSSGRSLRRVMHISRGLPLISAEQEPHLPALQFQRHREVVAPASAWIWWTASSTTIPSVTSVVIVLELAALAVAAPDAKGRRCHLLHLLDDLLQLRGHCGMIGTRGDLHPAVRRPC